MSAPTAAYDVTEADVTAAIAAYDDPTRELSKIGGIRAAIESYAARLAGRGRTLPAGPWTIRDEDVAAVREAITSWIDCPDDAVPEDAVRAGLYLLADRLGPSGAGEAFDIPDLVRAGQDHPDAVAAVAAGMAEVGGADTYEPWTAESAVAALVARGWRPPGESADGGVGAALDHHLDAAQAALSAIRAAVDAARAADEPAGTPAQITEIHAAQLPPADARLVRAYAEGLALARRLDIGDSVTMSDDSGPSIMAYRPGGTHTNGEPQDSRARLDVAREVAGRLRTPVRIDDRSDGSITITAVARLSCGATAEIWNILRDPGVIAEARELYGGTPAGGGDGEGGE